MLPCQESGAFLPFFFPFIYFFFCFVAAANGLKEEEINERKQKRKRRSWQEGAHPETAFPAAFGSFPQHFLEGKSCILRWFFSCPEERNSCLFQRMRGSKRRHLTAPECEALARSAEGSAPLRRPLGLATGGGGGGGGGSRGLHPIHGTRRHPRGAARQRNILEFFAIQKRPEVGTAGMENCGIKEDPMDPVFPGSGDSFRSRAQSCGIRENPMDPVFPGSQDSFRSRAQSCGIRENPMDPVFPGSQDSFRSRAQSCGITEEPLDLDPVFPGSQDSFRSRAQNCGIRQDPMDPIFPGESFRSTRNSGIRQDPMDPIYTEDSFWSRAQSCGIKEDPMDPIFPGSQDSFRSR
ncbi:uncharacterized protein LOC131378798, partial [Hirundo rustica]|uniref:uncharacterized protein LOC131378798 n=1 Tax=Hirundo rustica TaxID=43150 RepID=UPI002671A7F3